MEETKKQSTAGKVKRSAAVSAVALLTAASVMTGSLFESPTALLSNEGAPTAIYAMANDYDGAADDGSDVDEDEGEETRRRGGVRAMLRERILRLPLVVRLLAVLPLWALGSVILAAAGAAWPLLSPVLGKVAGFALMLALLLGSFLLAAKAAFPDLPIKKLVSRRNLVALLLGASALTVADAVLGAVWGEYEQSKDIILSVGFFLALSCATVPFALREQKRRLSAAKAAAQRVQKPDKLIFTDGVGTYTVRVPKTGG